MPRAVIRIRKDPAYRREAFESGLKRIGYTVLDGSRDNKDWQPDSREDLLVLWNRKDGLDQRMADTWEGRGGTVLVVENAYLQKVDKSMYAISVGQHNGAGWFPVGDEDRFTPLGFVLHEMECRAPGAQILVVGQRGIGSRLMASPPLWGEKHVEKLGKKHAWLRPHPGVLRPRVPLDVDLDRAREVHIWSSSVGVRALIEGIPVRHHAPHWICGINPTCETREWALNRMAHGQWAVAEVASGEPFARMRAGGWGC